MLGIKRLHTYLLQSFLPVFAMTFGICLFLVLMQFLWKYVEDLVGKGLEPSVIGELFFYAALNLVPLALPLAILLASLMTFGNMGESLELLATKAAGISLIRTMRPLIVFMVFVSIGAFFFQNNAVPEINVKFATLLKSVKMKSPELDIPEGSFYNEIDNYSLFVKQKDKETKMLRGVTIYDTSKGFNNMAVIVCDSAMMRSAASKDYLKLTLFNGQQFANFNRSATERNVSQSNNKFVPYSRENFRRKEIIITFDANFNRLDESVMEGSQISKNIYQLNASIDSISRQIDSLNLSDRRVALEYTYLSYRQTREREKSENKSITYKGPNQINIDSLFTSYSAMDKIAVLNNAIGQTDNNNSDYFIRSGYKVQAQKSMRAHRAEFHRKFTLSFACLVFFFIGAPLGAIIRKGGLGMPVVVSVILFIIYYIIDNVGYKMARDGVWEAWEGVWLSSFVLFPLGVFLTYKANNDSALFNPDAYMKVIRRIIGQDNIDKINPFFGTIFDKIKRKKKTVQDESFEIREKSEKDWVAERAHGVLESYRNNAIAGIIFYIVSFISALSFTMNVVAIVFGIICFIVYLILYVKILINHLEFYKILNKRLSAGVQIAYVLMSFSLFCFMVFYYVREMKKDLEKYKRGEYF